MAIEFYDVKEREKVKIDESNIKKTKYERKLKDGSTQIRYAFRAQTSDGRSLTKFCSKNALTIFFGESASRPGEKRVTNPGISNIPIRRIDL